MTVGSSSAEPVHTGSVPPVEGSPRGVQRFCANERQEKAGH